MNISTTNFSKGGQIREDIGAEAFTLFLASVFSKNSHNDLGSEMYKVRELDQNRENR